jgi:hypothetical protein
LKLEPRLARAFEYFYPDAVHEGYRPDVVDFFSSLRTYLDVVTGLPGSFEDAPNLYRHLKSAIAHLLIEGARDCADALKRDHSYLKEIVQPGNVIVTSNWDPLIERYAAEHSVPVRLHGTGDDNELVLLKLHGSIDWCLGQHMTQDPSLKNYARLNERLNPAREYRPKLPTKRARENRLLRIRMLDKWSSAWLMVRSRASEPHIVTMVRSKAGDLGPLRGVWRDAYGAVSRARRLEVVGYSMPPDDVEIRTILRAGVQRGTGLNGVIVRNPTPDVHIRVRQFLDLNVASDYRGVSQS